MADAVERAIRQGHHLVVEAGTGVGKSFAYLVPAILAATGELPLDRKLDKPRPKRDDEEDKPPLPRVIVSTLTISLQEQLIQKDLPLLRSVMPQEFTAVLFKGRSNYISLRRMETAQARSASLFHDEAEFTQLREIVQWSKRTT